MYKNQSGRPSPTFSWMNEKYWEDFSLTQAGETYMNFISFFVLCNESELLGLVLFLIHKNIYKGTMESRYF